MMRLVNKFCNDETGEITVEFVVIIASAVVLSIAAIVIFAPGLGTAAGYSVNLLNFDREGTESPECRYVQGYQDSPHYKDGDGNIVMTCAELYNLQREGVDISDPYALVDG